jgi:phosphate transport system substrate-binding protein
VISGKWLQVASVAGVLALSLAACGDDNGNGSGTGSNGGEELSGEILVAGSSTVTPLMERGAQLFQQANSGVRVTVTSTGTTAGFERFCRNETDISMASRPIQDEEVTTCGEAGVEFDEVQVANDALSAVVHPDNPLTCISIESLHAMWDEGSTVDSWGDVPGLETDVPDESLELYGPGTDSGTFDYWTEAVNGDEDVIRTDYSSIGEDDNAAINAVAGDPWASAYVPFSFIEEAGGIVKPLAIVSPDTGECVEPTLENVLTGVYVPLGRPLFIYPKGESLQRPEVVAFLEFYMENQEEITSSASYVPMNEDQVAVAQAKVDELAGS